MQWSAKVTVQNKKKSTFLKKNFLLLLLLVFNLKFPKKHAIKRINIFIFHNKNTSLYFTKM